MLAGGRLRHSLRRAAHFSIALGFGQEYSKRIQVQSPGFYLATLTALTIRYIDVADLCIGMVSANWRQVEILESIGLYLNLVSLRVVCDMSQSFDAALEDMWRKSCLSLLMPASCSTPCLTSWACPALLPTRYHSRSSSTIAKASMRSGNFVIASMRASS